MENNDDIGMPSIKEMIIDSIVSTKTLFLGEQSKKLYQIEELQDFKTKFNLANHFQALNANTTIHYGRPPANNSALANILQTNQEKNIIDNDTTNDVVMKSQEVPEYSLARNKENLTQKPKNPQYHPKWKLYKVISGHTGWVRCIDVDPTNNWFVTGSNDRVIKFWDLATGKLKLSLTGHINTVRAVVVSPRHPYLFSCGEDKMVKCWDLEQNKVIRHYHGHLSGVYCLSLHPTLDVLVTGGRDCVARVWDMRSRQQILCLEGHTNTVCSVSTQEHNPQIITGSNDSTIRLWDIGTGKLMNTLTHHKKSIRSIIIPEDEYTFVSGGCDTIKVWKCPEGNFLRSIQGQKGILNSIALNTDGVLVSGGEDGILHFWDYKTGIEFQTYEVPLQPGSLSCESGIFDIKFDKTSTRMITAGCDKTIKMWKEEE